MKRGRKAYSEERLLIVQVTVELECKKLNTSSINEACKSLEKRGQLFWCAYSADGREPLFVKLSASAISGAYYRARRKSGRGRLNF
jgi:hypothetical protein